MGWGCFFPLSFCVFPFCVFRALPALRFGPLIAVSRFAVWACAISTPHGHYFAGDHPNLYLRLYGKSGYMTEYTGARKRGKAIDDGAATQRGDWGAVSMRRVGGNRMGGDWGTANIYYS